MDLLGQVILVYLEEDNTQRAFFRIRLLLTAYGALSAEEIAAYPDDGYLRIVPDKNEQHTFKERMRAMGGICALNLRDVAPEANKIRTNKNYAPARGETNQFIVYSDAVQPLPKDLLYEVVAENALGMAMTPLVYARSGGNIYGPLDKETGLPVGEQQKLLPDSPQLHAVTLPDGRELLIYWAKPAQAPAPEVKIEAPVAEAPAPAPVAVLNAIETIQALDAPLNEKANRLNAPAKRIQPMESPKRLAGTPLFVTPKPATPPLRVRNSLIETVDQQRYAAKYEAPGAVLAADAHLRDVQNPVEQFKRALQSVWQAPQAQRQVVSAVMEMPGMRPMLAKSMGENTSDFTIAAMHAQLQELEADRLMTLMQLDKAKADMATLREDALAQVNREQKAAQAKLQSETERLTAALKVLEDQVHLLNAESAALQENADLLTGAPCLRRPAGVSAPRKELIMRVQACLKAQGFRCDADDAQALLMGLALNEGQLSLLSDTAADALLAVKALAAALGAAYSSTAQKSAPGGDGLAFAVDAVLPSIPTVYLQNNAPAKAYEYAPFARLYCQASDALPGALPIYPAIAESCLQQELLGAGSELSADAQQVIANLRQKMKELGAPLPLGLCGQWTRFVCCAQNTMQGGVSAALDYGVRSYVLPYAQSKNLSTDVLNSLLAAFPRTLTALHA